MYDRLCEADKNAFLMFMADIKPLSANATVCAGAECPTLVNNAIAELAKSKATTKWVSELSATKRDFLRKAMPDTQVLYGGLETLFNGEAPNYAVHQSASSKKSTAMTTVDFDVKSLEGGFPCQSVSSMNANQSQFRDAVKSGSGKTGSVWKMILELLDIATRSRQRGQAGGVPQECLEFLWALFENVIGLAVAPKDQRGVRMSVNESNLGFVVDSLYRRGHMPVVLMMQPYFYAHPVSRPRLYIPMCSEYCLRQFQIGESELVAWVQDSSVFVTHASVGRVAPFK
jgi:site-specific DNA-cytosine methylase